MSVLNDNEIPIGLGMALAENLDALNAFSALDTTARSAVISRSRNVRSKRDMEKIVSELLNG